MKFWEAMKALDEGNKIRSTYWCPGHYIFLNQNLEKDYEIDTSHGCLRDQNDHHIFLSYEYWVLIHDDWEIYEKPKREWKYVLKYLKLGKKFRRMEWENEDWAIKVVEGKIVGVQTIIAEPTEHIFEIEDFEANDWIEVE